MKGWSPFENCPDRRTGPNGVWREREKEREREGEREKGREREKKKQTDRHTEIATETERKRLQTVFIETDSKIVEGT